MSLFLCMFLSFLFSLPYHTLPYLWCTALRMHTYVAGIQGLCRFRGIWVTWIEGRHLKAFVLLGLTLPSCSLSMCLYLLPVQNHFTWFLFSPDLPLPSYFSFTFLYRSLTPFLEKSSHHPQPFTYYRGTPAALQTGLWLPVRVHVWLSFSVLYSEKGKMPPLLHSSYSEFIGWMWVQPP